MTHTQDIVMDDIPIAILVIQRDHQIIVANKQSHALFGYDAGELVGKQLEVLVPKNARSRHYKMAEEYWKEPCNKIVGSGRDLQGLRKDGVLIPVEIGLYPYNGNIMVCIVDVTIRYVKGLIVEMKMLAEKMQKIVDVLEKDN